MGDKRDEIFEYPISRMRVESRGPNSESQKLFCDTFTNAELKQLHLCDTSTVVQKQHNRLGVKDKRITLEQLGLDAIKNGNNLFNLVKKGKAKIIDARASQFEFKITIETQTSLQMSLQSGTLLYPADDPKKRLQTTLLKDQLKTELHPGLNHFNLKTFCYNKQLQAPHGQQYLLCSIRCIKHSSNLNQKEVWDISLRKKEQIEVILRQYEKKDQIKMIRKQEQIQRIKQEQIERTKQEQIKRIKQKQIERTKQEIKKLEKDYKEQIRKQEQIKRTRQEIYNSQLKKKRDYIEQIMKQEQIEPAKQQIYNSQLQKKRDKMKPELIERRSKIKSVPKDNDDVELTEKKQYIALTRRKINELLETWDI